MKYSSAFVSSMLLTITCSIHAQSINPEGLYSNAFSGGVNGQEVILIRPLENAENQYRISNVNGRGFIATIQPNGQINIDPFGVVGNFNTPDTAQFSVPQAQPSQYQLTRMALTDNNFVSYNNQAFPVNPLYEGAWSGTERAYDIITGAEIQDATFPFIYNTILSRQVNNDGIEGFRSTEFINGVLNGFFQGVMDSQRSWIVQIGDSPLQQADPELAMQTILGSTTGFPRRFIARGQFEDINTFTNTVLVEHRADMPILPEIKMFLFQQTMIRQQPLTPGDFDGNGSIEQSDRDQISELYGLDDFRNNYNLLADIDNNGIIDLRDITAVDGGNTQLMTIDAGFSGSWFNTGRSGEGWNLAILPGNRAILAFFTFAPDGSTQVWVVGVGQVFDNEIIFSDLNITAGALFGDQFDPNDVQRSTWGDIRIYFTDCNNGAISYASDNPFDNNARPISRLTLLAGVGCGQTPAVITASQVVTGTWFSPSRDGEGIIFEALPDGRVVMYWYTFDVEGGQQYWLGGVGQFDATTNTVQFDMLRSSLGTSFGDGFVAGDVVQIPWGSASFQQLDCDSGILDFAGTLDGFGNGSYNLIRLTSVDSLACNPEQFSQ